ncbi:MAG: hypothetical protein AAGI23_15225 [Bacteroidota bacterium]
MKQLQFFLFPILLCLSFSLFGQSEYFNHRELYIATLEEDDYEAVHDILQTAFEDFPTEEDNKIKYKSKTQSDRLTIRLNEKRIWIFYRSQEAETSQIHRKIEAVKAKIELEEVLSLNQ